MKSEIMHIRLSKKQKEAIETGAKKQNETITKYVLRKVLQNDLFRELETQSKTEKQNGLPKKEFLQKLKRGLISNTEIATILNVRGYKTAHGKDYTRFTVNSLLASLGIVGTENSENENSENENEKPIL